MGAVIEFKCDDCRTRYTRVLVVNASGDGFYNFLPRDWHIQRHLPPRDEEDYYTCPQCFERNRRLARGESNGG